MTLQKIFLSYRRDDIPGYVARLEDEFARRFGVARVFRDVEDIVGGSDWKNVIEQNLVDAGALILVIGPRWNEIWTARQDDPVNYVALELQRARDLGIKIIPVTLGHASISQDIDLGGISWLRDKQVYNISDQQGRWHSDVQGLIKILQNIPSIGSPQQAEKPRGKANPRASKKKWFLAASAILIITIAALGFRYMISEMDPKKPSERRTSSLSTGSANKSLKMEPKKVPKITLDQAVKSDSERMLEAAKKIGKHPDISGIWRSQKNGTAYEIKQLKEGRFKISRADGKSGLGSFLDKMPRKAHYVLDGVGQGQLTLSNSEERIHIWLTKKGTSEQLHDTLLKTSSASN